MNAVNSTGHWRKKISSRFIIRGMIWTRYYPSCQIWYHDSSKTLRLPWLMLTLSGLSGFLRRVFFLLSLLLWYVLIPLTDSIRKSRFRQYCKWFDNTYKIGLIEVIFSSLLTQTRQQRLKKIECMDDYSIAD